MQEELHRRARYSRPRHYANANLAPPILFSSETVQAEMSQSETGRHSQNVMTLKICDESLFLPLSRIGVLRPTNVQNNSSVTRLVLTGRWMLAGIPLAVHDGRPSSRASSQRSVGTFTSGFSRRPSSGGSRGVLVPASRAGAARAAAILLISCHLTTTTTTAFMKGAANADDADPDSLQQAATSSRTGKLSSGDLLTCVM
ncbi:unnamed protein product [Timema podura]|uniref:Uncharacterized protein n=1 Tax=Timema podura TaxID=61482 RepID=A0ABN7NK46_TIMPD|nr:unnamed protein product [Timema podura]